MHTQLQGTTTSLKILLGNAVITPAVHHLSERDHTLGVAVLCLGSSENTTKSRKCGSTAADKNTNNEERKMMPGSREGDISHDEVLHFPFSHKEMELCQKPCRCVSDMQIFVVLSQ